MTTYIVGGISGSRQLGLWRLAVELEDAGVPDVIGPVQAYDRFPRLLNAAVVGFRGLGRCDDPDAVRLGARIASDHLVYGERRRAVNVIALSGGATTAFNAADLLTQVGIMIDHLVTIGGVALRRAPAVREWSRIVGGLDPLALLAPRGADRVFILRRCLHNDYLGNRRLDTMACLRTAGVVPELPRASRAIAPRTSFPSQPD